MFEWQSARIWFARRPLWRVAGANQAPITRQIKFSRTSHYFEAPYIWGANQAPAKSPENDAWPMTINQNLTDD
ncbi:MAG TPA: hypothetical protein VG099_10490, partial [Gemmataceae bacterium]|nr:hypothetical protein [Gemmataceae bacterium]